VSISTASMRVAPGLRYKKSGLSGAKSKQICHSMIDGGLLAMRTTARDAAMLAMQQMCSGAERLNWVLAKNQTGRKRLAV
jgi:hypothetical protein